MKKDKERKPMKYLSLVFAMLVLSSCATWKTLQTPPPGAMYTAPNEVDLGKFSDPLVPGMASSNGRRSFRPYGGTRLRTGDSLRIPLKGSPSPGIRNKESFDD